MGVEMVERGGQRWFEEEEEGWRRKRKKVRVRVNIETKDQIVLGDQEWWWWEVSDSANCLALVLGWQVTVVVAVLNPQQVMQLCA